MLSAYRYQCLRLRRAAFADRSRFFRGLELHRNLPDFESERLGELLPDRIPEVFEPWALENHGGIHIYDAIPLGADQVARGPQKLRAIGIFPFRIRIREMHADVAQGGGAEQSVGDGVRENIGVGVTFQSKLGLNLHSTQDERPAGPHAVHIPALSYSQIGQEETRGANSSARNKRARSISDGF